MQDTLIGSRDNASVKRYRRLRDSKRFRRQDGLFVAEGLRIVRDALQKPGLVETVFLTETAIQHEPDLAGSIPASVRMIRITDSIGAFMADTEHTQGVFAICRQPSHEIRLDPDGKYLVLCNLQDPGNMGMILRTADALGVDVVISCESCEVFSPKVVRATMGSILRVPVMETTGIEALAEDLHAHGIRSYAAVICDAVPLPACSFSGGCAVWIGNEGNGLPQEAIDVCDVRVTIPMRGGPESLNAAMAAGILMWEMTNGGGNGRV